jgi:hypothetical protein
MVLDDLASRRHRPQRYCRLAYFLGSGFPLRSGGEQFQRFVPWRLCATRMP